MVPMLKNVGKSFIAKIYRPVSLLPVVSKIFERVIHDKFVDHLEKSSLFF